MTRSLLPLLLFIAAAIDVAIGQVDGLPETVFAKKRPGAPRGQIRSPRVRAMVEIF